jgi:Ca-activated chloride channel family protein
MHINAHLDVDLIALESDDTVTVMLELDAPHAPETSQPRPEHTAVVVLDRSGSMSGPRLAHAKRALVDLVGRLDDRDRFGLVVFDDQASVAIPAGKVGDLGRDRLRHDIAKIGPGGMTDLSSGYLRGLQEARRVSTDTGATLVLLSDGHANSGETDPVKLQGVAHAAGKQAITTSTIGIGTGYDESILAALAAGGLGNHAFAEHGDAAAKAVADELDGLLSKTVQAANLLIEPTGDVTSIALLNDGLPAQRVEGGVLAELGDFYAGETRKVTIRIDVPAMAALGLAQVATLTLNYVELPSLTQHTVTVPVSVNVVPFDVAQGRVPDPVVQREVLFLETQRAKKQAEEALADGDLDAAQQHLSRASQSLASAPNSILDDDLRAESDWLAESSMSLTDRDAAYNSKRLRSDYLRKSRGYKSRHQGGEVTTDGPSGGSESGSSDAA